MKKMTTRDLTCGAVIAALYVVLTVLQNVLLPGSASMAVQFRAAEALCVLALKPLGHSEYASGNQSAPDSLIYAVLAMAAAALLVLTLVCGWRGLIVGAAVVLGYAFAMWRCVRSLGGVSGDLAGFSLTVAELCGLIALAMI